MTDEVAQEKASPAAAAEVVALATAEAPEFRGYAGASTLVLSREEEKLLEAQLPDDVHDILPTGEVYVAQVQQRRRLNHIFGPGQWALVPRGDYVRQGRTLCREYALVVRGHFVADAVGEADYHESNDRMSWATAAEALKSNALTRCCKDLGIASECWDRRWTERWKAEHAVQVWVKDERRPQWRRRDAAPFWNERGPVDAQSAASTDHPAVDPKPEREQQAPNRRARGRTLNGAEIKMLFAVAKQHGVTSKEDLYPIATRACGFEVRSIKAIPADNLDGVIRELTQQPPPATTDVPFVPDAGDVDWIAGNQQEKA